jgi:hypothetical protein
MIDLLLNLSEIPKESALKIVEILQENKILDEHQNLEKKFLQI